MIDSPTAPPDISVPAQRGVMDKFSYLFLLSLTHLTKFCTSSVSFGNNTNLGRTSKMLASCEYCISVFSSSSASPLKNFLISSFTLIDSVEKFKSRFYDFLYSFLRGLGNFIRHNFFRIFG